MPGLTTQNGFQALVQALSDKLGPSRGIDSDDVDPSDLQKLMEDYVSTSSEWSQYAFASEHVPYTRNLVDKGNGKSNLVRQLSCDDSHELMLIAVDPGMGAEQRESYS